ncbi:MAG: transporter substrate-binding domain-containing protein [Propionibacteriaceae bacterium]|jgi:polar amino acid transport system substrate-binding protein|nr:transporter substrate-binding domain-containing protein [Propionibacteriaceae bacterium]
MKHLLKTAALGVVAAFALAGCGTTQPTGSAPASDSGSGAASAASSPAFTTIDAGKLTACADVPYPPFEIEDTSAASGYSGFDIEIVGAIAEKLGLTLVVKDVDFDALQSGTVLAAGECDLGTSAITITEKRKKNIDFADPYYDSLQSLLVKKDSGIAKLADLSGKVIGVQQGTTGQTYAQEHAPKDATITQFPSDGELWPAMTSGQVDAILQDQPVNHQHEIDDDSYAIVEEYDTDEQYGFAFAKDKNPELLAAVNAALADIRSDGTYDTIYEKYFGKKQA